MQTNKYEKNKLLLRLLLLRNLKKAAPKGCVHVHDLLVREVNSWILKNISSNKGVTIIRTP